VGGWDGFMDFCFFFGKDREEGRNEKKAKFLGALMEVLKNPLRNVF
jgi:hypothetical protein